MNDWQCENCGHKWTDQDKFNWICCPNCKEELESEQHLLNLSTIELIEIIQELKEENASLRYTVKKLTQ